MGDENLKILYCFECDTRFFDDESIHFCTFYSLENFKDSPDVPRIDFELRGNFEEITPNEQT